MADKRLYTIPLRDAWNVSIKKRSKRAMAVIRAFTEKHMKAESVKIGSDLNHLIWSRGIKNPPRKVKVQMVPHKKDDVETIWVDLATSSMDYLKEKKEKKKEKPKAKEAEEAKPEAGKKSEEKADKKSETKKVAEAKPEADKKPETKAGEKKAEPKAPEAKTEKAEPVKEKTAEKDKEEPKPAKEPEAETPKPKKTEAKPEPAKK
ncbi:hypothetical protein GQ472_03560 [archaeon]|nr:hypothetical protein [archaeon]